MQVSCKGRTACVGLVMHRLHVEPLAQGGQPMPVPLRSLKKRHDPLALTTWMPGSQARLLPNEKWMWRLLVAG